MSSPTRSDPPPPAAGSAPDAHGGHAASRTLPLTVGALGIVFGDIGTSPLYALPEALNTPGLPATQQAVLGVVSLVFWALVLIVSVRYLMFITAAHNNGEGGIFAIVSLLRARGGLGRPMTALLTGIALVSVALLFADSLITPPLSVMAALEGLETALPGAEAWVIPGTVAILLGVFAMQRWGTAALSRLFSPVMIAWFAIIGALGLAQVVQTPEILGALRPIHALRLAAALEWYQLFALMGSVLLAVTGAEAIYADMGHFGRRPVALAWYLAALHGLLLNYLGQGAWLLRQGGSIPKDTTPFFGIVPDGWLVPMVVLAAAASVIASQAAISGLFSLTRQAVQLGYLPRLRIVQTSATEQGQIYVPRINLLLCVGCVALVFVFGSSSALAGAYGFAVAGTMLLTSVAFTVVIVVLWRWSPWKVAAFCLLAIPLDLMFLGATITKLPAGHFFTVIVALIAVALLGIWLAGNARLMGLAQRLDMPVSMFAETLAERTDLIRQPRPAVFLQHLPFPPEMGITPTVLLKQVQVTGLRYAPTVVVHFVTDDRPRVPPVERLSVEDHGQDVHSATILGGFAEGLTLAPLIEHGLRVGWWRDEAEIVYFAGREQLRSGTEHALPGWMRAPFRMLHRHDESLARTLRLPASRYVEIGIVIDV